MFREFVGVEGNNNYEIALNRNKLIQNNSKNQEFLKSTKDKLKLLLNENNVDELKDLMESMFYERLQKEDIQDIKNTYDRSTNLNSFIDVFIDDYINYGILGFVHCKPCLKIK